jgi:hypothetical protein
MVRSLIFRRQRKMMTFDYEREIVSSDPKSHMTQALTVSAFAALTLHVYNDMRQVYNSSENSHATCKPCDLC